MTKEEREVIEEAKKFADASPRSTAEAAAMFYLKAAVKKLREAGAATPKG